MRFTKVFLFASLFACTSAHADVLTPVGPRPLPAPYGLELIGPDGATLPTYGMAGRLYVMGLAGQRYSIRVTNPTARRVEAVVSVDGLDAIDGTTADFLGKRGYVIQPYGELRLDGFRVSM